MDILSYRNFFFIGIAGTGMSAIAQYLNGIGKNVFGSDRGFKDPSLIQTQFKNLGIKCFLQDASGIDQNIDVVVISTAIEESNIELVKARSLNIPIITRSKLLAEISKNKKTIAVGGTSGKSTTSAMIFHILNKCGLEPSIIAGAGLTELQKQGLPGNAWIGKSEWLVIEADESDGSIVNYIPEIGLLLNVERDHKEYDELKEIFGIFKQHTKKYFIVNEGDEIAKTLSQNSNLNFSSKDKKTKFYGDNFVQNGFGINFYCNGVKFSIPIIGKHNMENALAATAVCSSIGLSIENCAKALESYEGIYRRSQLIGKSNKNVLVIDDFAHNPSEIACAIRSCQNIGKRVFAWYQPHGFGPLKFTYKELIKEVCETIRPQDIFILSDVYYAGGTVNMDFTSKDVFDILHEKANNTTFFHDRNDIIPFFKEHCKDGDIILTMGARDTSLSDFANKILKEI